MSTSVLEEIIIVSGLPRSGTSMMMQMLEAGGVPTVTDHLREPDADNPHGYFELEKTKRIQEDVSWLEQCTGQAIKVVSALLTHLPSNKKFKVIFMERDLAEVLASQKAMLLRRDREDNLEDIEIGNTFAEHLTKIKTWLQRNPNIEVLAVNYRATILHPRASARRINSFLDGWLDEEKMAGVVHPSLYRQRGMMAAVIS